MFWLFLLGICTLLTIALRRALRRQKPLNEELDSKKIAIEHIQTGVAWVRGDGQLGFVNPAFSQTMNATASDLAGQQWSEIFDEQEHDRVREAYRQALLCGVQTFTAAARRADGAKLWLNVRLVPAHDHKMRFLGHYCFIEDRTRERELEEMLRMDSGRITRPAKNVDKDAARLPVAVAR